MLSFSRCSAAPGFRRGIFFVGFDLSGIRSGGSAESGGRGGKVLDSGNRSGAVWGSGVGEGELSGAVCPAGAGADSAGLGLASLARTALWNGVTPKDTEKSNVATNQATLTRNRTLNPLF